MAGLLEEGVWQLLQRRMNLSLIVATGRVRLCFGELLAPRPEVLSLAQRCAREEDVRRRERHDGRCVVVVGGLMAGTRLAKE